MLINCDAEYYSYTERDGHIFFYNNLYSTKTPFLFLTALATVLAPDSRSFNVPIAADALAFAAPSLTLDKKLTVIGADSVKYFIPKQHADKWKKSYLPAACLLLTIGIILNLVCLAAFFTSSFNILAGAAFWGVTMLIIAFLLKLINALQLLKKHDIIDWNEKTE